MDLSHKWWIVIRGPEDWFPQFITRFNHSSFEVDRVSWETRGSPESGVALATARLDRCKDFDGARVVVESEVSVLSGLARLLWEGIPPVKGAFLIQVDKGRFVAGALLGVPQIAILQGGSPVGIEQYLLTSDQPKGENKEDVVKRLEKPKLALALQHYGREKPNWGSLFKVYELLRGQYTDEGLCATGLVSKAQLTRFRSTANLPSLGGMDARHADRTGDAPAPMTLSEAHGFIRPLLAAWLSPEGPD